MFRFLGRTHISHHHHNHRFHSTTVVSSTTPSSFGLSPPFPNITPNTIRHISSIYPLTTITNNNTRTFHHHHHIDSNSSSWHHMTPRGSNRRRRFHMPRQQRWYSGAGNDSNGSMDTTRGKDGTATPTTISSNTMTQKNNDQRMANQQNQDSNSDTAVTAANHSPSSTHHGNSLSHIQQDGSFRNPPWFHNTETTANQLQHQHNNNNNNPPNTSTSPNSSVFKKFLTYFSDRMVQKLWGALVHGVSLLRYWHHDHSRDADVANDNNNGATLSSSSSRDRKQQRRDASYEELLPHTVPRFRWGTLESGSENGITAATTATNTTNGSFNVTWIGHCTFLIETESPNVSILLDPVFSSRASPFSFAGPKRYVKTPVTVEDLPEMPHGTLIVLISHNHYDHLDRKSVDDLWKKYGNGRDGIRFYVPLGLKKWFRKEQQDAVIEMDWWQMEKFTIGNAKQGSSNESDTSPVSIPETRIHSVPAKHWTMRTGPWDRNRSLWSGFVVEQVRNSSPNNREGPSSASFYYSGDTGYSQSLFKEISKRFPSGFDLSFLPIGAYYPEYFMKEHHMNPEESVQSAVDTNSRHSLATHWGTFPLTDEPLLEPVDRLEACLKERNLPADFFVHMRHGESREIHFK